MNTRANPSVAFPKVAPKKKAKKIKMAWKDRAKVRKYFGEQPRMIRKLAHVLKSNGPEEAARWVEMKEKQEENSVIYHLREIGRNGVGGDGHRNTKIAELARKALAIIEVTTSRAG